MRCACFQKAYGCEHRLVDRRGVRRCVLVRLDDRKWTCRWNRRHVLLLLGLNIIGRNLVERRRRRRRHQSHERRRDDQSTGGRERVRHQLRVQEPRYMHVHLHHRHVQSEMLRERDVQLHLLAGCHLRVQLRRQHEVQLRLQRWPCDVRLCGLQERRDLHRSVQARQHLHARLRSRLQVRLLGRRVLSVIDSPPC